jgi:hypothetical protein
VTHLIAVLALLPLFGAMRGDAQSLRFELRLTDGQIYTGAYPEGAPGQPPRLRPGRIEDVGGGFDSTYYKGCVSFGDGSRCNLMSSSQAGRAQHDVAQGSVDRVQSYDRQLDAHLAALDAQIQQLAAGQRPPEGSPAAQELARLGGIAEQARRELSSAKNALAEARAASDSRSGEQASEVTPIDLPELEYEPEHTYDDPTLNADLKAYQAAASNLQAPRSVDPRPYLTPQDSEWGKKVDAADRYVRRAEGVVERMQADPYQRMMHRPTLAMARDSVLLGDQSLAGGALEDGQAYLDVAYQLADVAMGFVPGVGWGKDVYESVTGINLLTGQSLSDTERAFAVLGVLTVGVGSKLANFGKVANLLRRFGKMDELVDAEKLAEAMLEAERVFDSAKKFGYRSTDDFTDFATKLQPSPNSSFTHVLYPRGRGASIGTVPDGYTKVSRWIGDGEVKLWHQGGGTRIPPEVSSEGRLFVTAFGAPHPGSGTGANRVDFFVPKDMLNQAGGAGWYAIFQPGQTTPILNVEVFLK